MFKGTVFALSACFIWGLIFVVPQFMSNFSPIEIVVGRYCVFGSISLLFLFRERLRGFCSYPLSVWMYALFLSFLAGYYLWVVLGIRYASPEICALICGISPITIALYGNWKQKECNFKLLILPSLLMLAGLVMVNAPRLTTADVPSEYIIGLICSLISLASWSAYVVLNSRYLKNNPTIRSDDWATMQGVTTLCWVAIFGIGYGLYSWESMDVQKYLTWNEDTMSFLIGCTILGLFCSWVGATLWNKASIYLPVSISGQLMIFETIFGVLFVYLLNQELPSLLESLGIVLLLGAVIHGIRVLSPQPTAV